MGPARPAGDETQLQTNNACNIESVPTIVPTEPAEVRFQAWLVMTGGALDALGRPNRRQTNMNRQQDNPKVRSQGSGPPS